MKKLLVIILAAAALWAVDTRFWIQSESADFDKATLEKLSLRSDGLLTLAPVFREVFDSSSAYLWTLAEDSKGNLYAGGGGSGGSNAKLYVIPPGGQAKTLAELEGLEVHAIAVDRRDRVYAATSPDGKIYRVSARGQAEIFYAPGAKYIWAMAFNSRGELFVATGDQGEIHRVSPDGKGSVFFRTEETHARSLAVDGLDNLVAGTEPGGLILRVSPEGKGFVLYQSPKREVTALAVAKDGAIYAAAVGNKQPAATPLSVPIPALAPIPVTPAPAPGAPHSAQRPAPSPPPPVVSTAPAIVGGSELYRIEPDGSPRKVWSHAQDIIYAIGFDAQGRPLLGTGNRGLIYRLDSERLHTVLVKSPATQVTAFSAGRAGRLYAASANLGKVYQLGAELEKSGYIESEVFDAGSFAHWGRLSFRGEPHGGRLTFAARSGNLDRPRKNWSPWSVEIADGQGGRIEAPPARFLQWRASLTASANGRSPELRSLEIAYLPKNIAPFVELIEITPANYRYPPPPSPSTAPANITLPPIGRGTHINKPPTSDGGGVSMQWAKGHLGVRWNAADDNGDTLVYTVHIRGVQEAEWKLLKDGVKERFLSWDGTAFPDGEYRLRVTASDAPSNPPEQALKGQLESEPFKIDNTPPQIAGLDAAREAGKWVVRWKAADALSVLYQAEYSIDGGEWAVVEPVTGLTDSREHEYRLVLNGLAAGEHTIAVRVADEYDNQAVDKVVLRAGRE